jgi:hypothetical protein
VPTALQAELDNLKLSHTVTPLPVYRLGQFVEPLEVTRALTNALVEVHFRIKHYHIARKDGAFDSFSGIVEQVVILKDGMPKAPNAYKRKKLRDGPFRPKPSITLPATVPNDNAAHKKAVHDEHDDGHLSDGHDSAAGERPTENKTESLGEEGTAPKIKRTGRAAAKLPKA